MNTTTLTSPFHGKILVPFCLREKRPENAVLTLTANYCKILIEKEIMAFKTTVNSLFNDI